MAKGILIVCDGFLPPKAKVAGGKNLYSIQRYLSSKGFRMHLLSFIHQHTDGSWQKWKESEEGKFNLQFHIFDIPLRGIYPLHLFLTKFLSFFIALYLQMVKRFDIIHEYSSAPFLINRTSLLGLLTGAKTVHTLCTINCRSSGSEKLVMRSADKIICSTENMKNKLKKRIKKEIEVIPIPVDDRFFQAALNDWREKFKLKTEKVILFCGLLDNRKGISCLLEAIPEIMSSNPDAGIIIVTAPGMNTSAVSQKNREGVLSFSDKYKDRMLFIEDEVDMAALLSVVDVHIYPPLTMHGTLGSPSILIEGMVSGKAIAASGLPEIVSIIRDRENGLLFEPGDSRGLAGAVNELLKNQELRRHLGSQAKIDSAQYRISAVGDKIEKIYHHLLFQQ